MSREQLVEMTRRTLVHSRNGTVPLEDGVKRIPSKNYYEPERWRVEMDRIFRRVPLVLGFTAELGEPNSYKAMVAMGTPVLLVRCSDGVVRSFVNMCSHRGAQVAEPGLGNARRFTCP
jgi:phenylpropionate dioxygenase-like ring-hydroxylating dioxygenase large terminal subunit